MANLCLDNFDKSDRLKNYVFESEWIKMFSREQEGIEDDKGVISTGVFEFKTRINITRKPKKDKLVFMVNEEFIHTSESWNGFNDNEFKDEQTAIEFFLGEVEEKKFLAEETKKNIVFDGMRYFWKINDKDEVVERC